MANPAIMAPRPSARFCLKYEGAKMNIKIPATINAMPPLFGLLCSLCAIA